MKVNKKLLLYIGLTVYLFLAGMLGYVYYRQSGEKESITEELATARAGLDLIKTSELEDQKASLEIRIDELTSQAENLKDMLSLEIDNVYAARIVFTIAEQSGVDVVALTSPSAVYDMLENVPCSIIPIDVTVEGDRRDLVEFVTNMNTVLDTGIIRSVEMELQEGANQSHSRAAVALEIYSYQGD